MYIDYTLKNQKRPKKIEKSVKSEQHLTLTLSSNRPQN